MQINIIDFEASGLGGDSYPIQVGIVKEDGSEYSNYIRPTDNWLENKTWNYDSQQIHNIPQQLLCDMGKDPKTVAQELNEFMGDGTVHCDGGMYDIMWCNVLYEEANIVRTWKISGIAEFEVLLKRPWYEYKELYAELDNFTEHDALHDARIIQKIILHSRANYLKHPPTKKS